MICRWIIRLAFKAFFKVPKWLFCLMVSMISFSLLSTKTLECNNVKCRVVFRSGTWARASAWRRWWGTTTGCGARPGTRAGATCSPPPMTRPCASGMWRTRAVSRRSTRTSTSPPASVTIPHTYLPHTFRSTYIHLPQTIHIPTTHFPDTYHTYRTYSTGFRLLHTSLPYNYSTSPQLYQRLFSIITFLS